MRWTSSFVFLLTNRIRIDHDVSNQSYKYKAEATNFSTNWNKEILKSLLCNFRSLSFTVWSRGCVILKRENNPSWKHIHHCHIALNTPCSSRPLFPISQGGGGRVCLRELNKMVGAYGQCENGESNKNNLQISTELKNLISATQILFTLEFLYAWICWLGEWGEVWR